MTPTNKLRFVKRAITIPTEWADGSYTISRLAEVRVLQQWHEYGIVVGGMNTGEWRDVPLETEE